MQAGDSIHGYGPVSRALHWGMALLIAWQIAGMACRAALGSGHPVTLALARNHADIGTLLLLLGLLRLAWALLNRHRRPMRPPGRHGWAVRVGHGTLYALMLAVPATALLRAWGNPRPFAPYGIPLFRARPADEAVSWAVDAGHMFHGLLAWLLLVAVLGHVWMALYHHIRLRDETLRRMLRGPR